jgi:multiple antibiotic resistance protein
MINELLIVTISLFAIVDPLTSIPVFISLFGKSERKRQGRAAFDAVLAAFILLLLFSAFGISLISYLNISMSAFMIAGGLLLLYLAFEFLLGELPKSRQVDKDPSEAVVPIGTPLLAGPGAITSAIYFTHAYGFQITFLAIVIVMLISFICLAMSPRVNRVLGRNGLKIFTRIMGLITAAIAISLIEKAMIAYGLILSV